MSEDRFKALNKLGFTWDHGEEQWQSRFAELKQYKKQHGHCNVPQSQGPLGLWVNTQRRNKKTMSQDRIKPLDKLGFTWDPHEENWQSKYAQLKLYKREHGHCNVPKSQGKLGLWVVTQRQSYNKGKLSEERIQKLVKLDFRWSFNDRTASSQSKRSRKRVPNSRSKRTKIAVKVEDEEDDTGGILDDEDSQEGDSEWEEEPSTDEGSNVVPDKCESALPLPRHQKQQNAGSAKVKQPKGIGICSRKRSRGEVDDSFSDQNDVDETELSSQESDSEDESGDSEESDREEECSDDDTTSGNNNNNKSTQRELELLRKLVAAQETILCQKEALHEKDVIISSQGQQITNQKRKLKKWKKRRKKHQKGMKKLQSKLQRCNAKLEQLKKE